MCLFSGGVGNKCYSVYKLNHPSVCKLPGLWSSFEKFFLKLVRVRNPSPVEMGDGGPGQESGLHLLPLVVYEQESIGKRTSDELSVSLTWGKCI